MNESETRAELIDPKLKGSGWYVVAASKVLREYHITAGKIQTGGGRDKPLIADYVLVHQGRKLASIEARSDEHAVRRETSLKLSDCTAHFDEVFIIFILQDDLTKWAILVKR